MVKGLIISVCDDPDGGTVIIQENAGLGYKMLRSEAMTQQQIVDFVKGYNLRTIVLVYAILDVPKGPTIIDALQLAGYGQAQVMPDRFREHADCP